jgi:hypothetical protein
VVVVALFVVVITMMNWQWMPAVLFVSYLMYGLVRPWVSRRWQREIEAEDEVEDLDTWFEIFSFCKEQALDCYCKSLAIRTEVGDELMIANTKNNIGSVLSAMKNFDRAMAFGGTPPAKVKEYEQSLERALLQCWASLYSVPSISYRRKRNMPENEVSMAVVVQRMVDSRTAGVLFTRSPSSGDRSVVVIEGDGVWLSDPPLGPCG